MNARTAANWVNTIRARLIRAVVAAESASLVSAKVAAVVVSSGDLTPKDLARAGHPFARRAPNAAFDPSVINKQTGRFAASWRVVPPTVSGDSVVSGLVNTDLNKIYLQGTSRMVPRPVAANIARRVNPNRARRLSAAFRKVFTTK